MRPSKLLVRLFLLLFLLGLGGAFFSFLLPVCVLTGAVLIGMMLADLLMGIPKAKLAFKRDYQSRYALGMETIVQATLTNRGRITRRLRLYDGLPDFCQHEGYPTEVRLLSSGFADLSATLTFQRRGDMEISPAYVEVSSPLRLWWRSQRVGTSQTVQVYPNYVPALNYGLLATSDRQQQMGIIKKRYRGMSKEFHQLRDYHEGDQLNTIDWKATSRFNRLISREFQEERDQNVLLVADCSVRTRSVDQDLPILDHLLNAMILISYMAIGQGDKVEIMNYGTREQDLRYLSAVKGAAGMASILNHVYNYQSSKSYGEYESLAKRIMSQSRKRSLIIILTNLRSEDQYGCVEALRLLSQKHVVLLASVQESSVTAVMDKPIYSTKAANEFLGAAAYEQDAEQLVRSLNEAGLSVMRSPLDRFSVDLANKYLDIRSELS